MAPSLCVVNQRFVVPVKCELVLKESYNPLFKKDDAFTIKDSTGKDLFKVDTKFWTMSQRRTLTDAEGNPIVEIRKKKMSIHGRWIAFVPGDEDKILFSFTPHLMSLHSKVDIHLNDGDKEPDFLVKGNFRAKSFEFIDIRGGKDEDSGVVVGKVKKESFYKGFEALLGRDNYFLTVEAGVDAAFLAVVALFIDETFHDKEDD